MFSVSFESNGFILLNTFEVRGKKFVEEYSTHPDAAFVIIKTGKVVATVQKTDNERLSIGDIDTLLESYKGAY